jgi:hypothetical protein
MASKYIFGGTSALGKASRLKKTAIAGGLMAAVGYGAAREDPIQHTMNATQEAVFGTDQVDNILLGTDLTARNFVGVPFGMEPTAGKGGATGALLGGGIGAVLGRGKVGKMIGAGIGAGVGGLMGGAAGFVNSNTGRLLFPRENPADMFSKRNFNSVPFNYRKANEQQVDRAYQSAAEYPFDTVGGNYEQRGYSQYATSTFPQRMTNRSWDSATGDIVLGSYNLRRG